MGLANPFNLMSAQAEDFPCPIAGQQAYVSLLFYGRLVPD